MATVRLTWADLNSGLRQEDEIRIYRAGSPFDADSLPSVLATIAADEVEYLDTTVALASYYYAVAMVKGSVMALAFTGEVEVTTGTPPPGSIEYFLATNSALQTLTVSATSEIVLGTEVFDSYAAFASNRFTVPPLLDGFYALVVASVLLNPARAQVSYLQIEKSADGGTTWTPVASQTVVSETVVGVQTQVLLAVGEIYRASFVLGATAQDVSSSALVQFGGIILEPVA